jgi:tetratricopeptide (TPR) repeat protein
MKVTAAKTIMLAASLVFPTWSFAQTKSKEAAAYANRGIAKLKSNDLNGAIADFNRAIQVDPKLARAYELRGVAKRRRHELTAYGRVNIFRRNTEPSANRSADLDSAIADFNHALELDPKNVNAYRHRGMAKVERGDRGGAIADFNHALGIDPKNAAVYLDRGHVKLNEGNLEEALADYNRSLQLDSNNANAYYIRGDAKVDSGDGSGAIADFNRALQLNPKDELSYYGRGQANFLARNWAAAVRDYERYCDVWKSNQGYARFGIWMARSQLGERESADKELAAHFAEGRTWPSKIQAYLLGNLSEREFLAAVSPDRKIDPYNRCEAWFYAGMKNLLDGNKAAATELFKKCVATGPRTIEEYAFAKAELKTLGQ